MRDLGHPADEWGTVPDTVMGGPSAISPIRVEYDVDREVHATAGQEAGATCSAVITGPQKGPGAPSSRLGKSAEARATRLFHSINSD